MRQYRCLIPLLFIFLFALAACAQSNAITPTATVPTVTPTSKPTKTQTPTYELFSTLDPNATLEPWELLRKQVKEFGIDCKYLQASISPKGNWAAAACGYENDQTLQIANESGTVWKLNFSDYLSEMMGKDGNPMGGLVPIYWTADDQYLFFSPYVAWDGGGTCFYGFGYGGLYRMSMKDGKISTILPLTDMMDQYFFAFSPDGRYLAYIDGNPHLLNLNTGDNYSINVDENISGNLTWSPDSSRLGFATCVVDPDDFRRINNSTIQIFTVSNHEKQIIKNSQVIFFSIEPGEDNSYFLISERDENWDEVFSLYYWDQGLIFTATPQP
jgi:hypothetical protein